MVERLAIVQLGLAAYMTGVIWFVQLVHYPLFSRVGPTGFERYAREHQRRTGWVVAPAMLAELATAVALAVATGSGPDRWPARVGLLLVAVIWTSTFALQVPAHRRLAAGFDAAVAARLNGTNWVRTAAWSARCVVLLWILL